MYKFINIQINKRVLPLFGFLKDNPTRTIGKGKHFILTYFKPLGFSLMDFSYKGITVTVEDTDDLDNYLTNGWQMIKDYDIASAQYKLLDVLGELEQELLSRYKTGSLVAIDGDVYHWIAYGLTNTEDVITFVKLFYLNGYSYEQITQLYASLTKSNRFNFCFMNTINNMFKEELNE